MVSCGMMKQLANLFDISVWLSQKCNNGVCVYVCVCACVCVCMRACVCVCRFLTNSFFLLLSLDGSGTLMKALGFPFHCFGYLH